MIKLQDFARECGVTDRAIQKHLKTYAEELEGLYQRKGPNGTWLTDEACEILRSKMKTQPIAVVEADKRVEELEAQVRELQALVNDKEKLLALAQQQVQSAQAQVGQLQEAAARVYALEEGKKAAEKEAKILEGFVQDAKEEIRRLTDEKAAEVQQASEALEQMREEAAQRLQEAEELRIQMQAERARVESMSLWAFLKEKRKKG